MKEEIPLEPREIQLRAYIEGEASTSVVGLEKPQPSNRVLIFDTETTADAAQQLRFGAFQIRDEEELFRQGLFYDPAGLTADEIGTLEAYTFGTDLEFMPVEEFVEEIFFQECADMDGVCVGFNLPFDLSRLAIDHGTAKRGKSGVFHHGFSLKLSPSEYRSRVRVKHLSHRAAFIQFADHKRPQKKNDKRKAKYERPRGFFVDVKTLAGALLAESHSLESLSNALKTATKKSASEDHGAELKPDYIKYALDDAQCTWECYADLIKRLHAHNLPNTHARELFSEASLGKAYLRALGVKPWLSVQPDFPKTRIGEILSTYYGGRSEVNIRRKISETAYCDFLSMYPTVNTLMGLWRFVIADGVSEEDATEDVRNILETWTPEDLLQPSNWKRLHCVVQIEPNDDVLPVRAVYGDALPRNESNKIANIGLNRLTCEAPLWFTLADCLASKFLSGRIPNLQQAIRFKPLGVQEGLNPIAVSGNGDYLVDPANDDFFKRIIQLRRSVVQRRDASDGAEKEKYDSEQKALKILANSTSYGIFVETLVEDHDTQKSITRYGYDGIPTKIRSKVDEKPGRYFHPLLATLITGAARLMLALSERVALDQGLDWVFCDTDGIAFAKPDGISRGEFIERVRSVCNWFKPLNPYDAEDSILQMEDENFEVGDREGDWAKAPPLYCYAVSAKRYALFNIDGGQVEIRKASAHGLGHLLPPYSDPDKGRKQTAKVAYWHKEHWTAICEAALEGRDHNGAFIADARLEKPAASRYAANTPDLLKWFSDFNEGLERAQQVKPFNFLLTFQAKNLDRLAASDLEAASWVAKHRPKPRPAGPYEKDPEKSAVMAFDRATHEPVPSRWLKTYTEVLQDYHLHAEAKFHGGFDNARGRLQRRHVDAFAIRHIGKEAHNWEEDYFVGTDADSAIVHGDALINRTWAIETIRAAKERFGVRNLCNAARVGDNLLKATCDSANVAKHEPIVRLVRAAHVLGVEDTDAAGRTLRVVGALNEAIAEHGVGVVAKQLGFDLSNLRKVADGKRKASSYLIELIEKNI
nr:hypothetical protein [uncultured Hyphomonas sp.]